jgi:uncharacterized protein (DUF924 family)
MNYVLPITALLSVFATASAEPPAAVDASAARRPTQHHGDAAHVVQFWRDAGPGLWFAKDAEFDALFRAHFRIEHEAAARGELAHWGGTPDGALALMILLDQYPRNAFRDTARMYATDEAARRYADAAIAQGHDRAVPDELQMFFYLPFAHSERVVDQERSVALCQRLGQPTLGRAEHHRDIVRRFGRFPHRNPMLGRPTTPEEQAYLDGGGFKG